MGKRNRFVPCVEQLETRDVPSAAADLASHGLLGLYYNNPNFVVFTYNKGTPAPLTK